jgi:hypothetical protein
MPAVEDAVPLSDEETRVIQWRRQWLLSGGFSKRNAELIATSKVDFRWAIQTLQNGKDKGFDEDFMMRLIL